MVPPRNLGSPSNRHSSAKLKALSEPYMASIVATSSPRASPERVAAVKPPTTTSTGGEKELPTAMMAGPARVTPTSERHGLESGWPLRPVITGRTKPA